MSEGPLIVNEIFHSIQGESSWAGLPCVFVRLTGCEQRCTYCDTEYAFDEGVPMSLGEIVDRVRGYACELVEVTGGEPLAQAATPTLCRMLCDAGLRVLVETSGACDISVLDPRVVRVMDLKCPSSGEAEQNRMENIEHLRRQDEVKFVIGNRGDYDWASEVIRRHALHERCVVLLSPAFGVQSAEELAGWMLADRLPVRMQLQLHKYIWSLTARGV